MALRDDVLKEAQRLRPLFEWAGQQWGFSPALLAAIAVRESECGLGLDINGLGDRGHGHGIMQVDDGSFGGLFDERYPRFWIDPMWSIATGAAILDAKWQFLAKQTSLEGRELTWTAVAAYNCGEGRMKGLAPQLAQYRVDDDEFWQVVDTYTANHNYARQVWQDANEFAKRGWVGELPTGPAAATPKPPVKPDTAQPPAAPPGPTPHVTAPPVAAQPQTYAVRPGDTLSQISKRLYGDPGLFRKLAYYNGICNPDVIQVGQILEVPSRTELLGASEAPPTTAAPPAAPGADLIVPKPGLTPPNGLDEIFSYFGNIRNYMNDDGTLDHNSWVRDALGQAVLPFPIPLSWDLGTKVQKIQCHKKLVDLFPEVLAAIEKAGLKDKIKNYGGCFAFRSKRKSGKLSTHSWGIAFDLNPLTNPMGLPGDMHPDVVAIFRKFGFKWGGDWAGAYQDPMHFQFCTGY